MGTDVLGCTTNQHLARFVFLLLFIGSVLICGSIFFKT
ncbi:hypothetical protein CIB84_000704 [Bambusicola thoracicus]|uniref:Uncharacterized protein n=1 Tax=Bambusicola thoracicus TaxID=9083 RepID=A0A2P4TGT9_BAMTH|nr:hypothetical protein CIB84_000704 [Bambusicola thoracicus]